jgi:hypothetical protein
MKYKPSRARKRTVQRLDQAEIERLIQTTYRKSKYSLIIKMLFQTGPALTRLCTK